MYLELCQIDTEVIVGVNRLYERIFATSFPCSRFLLSTRCKSVWKRGRCPAIPLYTERSPSQMVHQKSWPPDQKSRSEGTDLQFMTRKEHDTKKSYQSSDVHCVSVNLCLQLVAIGAEKRLLKDSLRHLLNPPKTPESRGQFSSKHQM